MKIKCKYKDVKWLSVMLVMSLPTINDILPDLGGARVEYDGFSQWHFVMQD